MRKWNGLAAALLAAVANGAMACPGCKEAAAGAGGFFASGYNWSILLMLGTVLSVIGFVVFLISKIARKEAASASKDAASDFANQGYWGKVTLPACGAIIAVLMILGSAGADTAGTVAVAKTVYTPEAEIRSSLAARQGRLLVAFKSEQCGVCKQMSPFLSKVAGEQSGKVEFKYVDRVASDSLAADFHVDNLPCLIFFKDGQELERREGLCTESELRNWVEGSLAK